MEKLYGIVAGSDERSLVLRLSRMEQQIEVLRQNVANNTSDLEELLDWRSKAAGVVAAVLILWTVVVTVLNLVLR